MSSVMQIDRLSRGIPVCLQESRDSKLLSISVWIGGGSARDPAGQGGLAHFCEHLLLRPLTGTGSRAHRLQLKTGALVSACTDPEWVVISAQAPVEQSRALVDLLSALVCDPYLEASGLAAEKEVVLLELRDEEPGPVEQLARTFRESAFTGHPCVRPIGGTPATVGGLEVGDVEQYFARFLNASSILVTAHGGTRPGDSTLRMLDEAFEGLPATPFRSDAPDDETGAAALLPPDHRPVRLLDDVSAVGSASGYGVLAGIPSAPRGSEEYWTALAFEVLMADGPGSLLTRWLRNERPWIHGAVSMTEAFSSWGVQYFVVRLPAERAAAAVEHLGQRWRTLPELVTDERVETLRNRVTSRALSSLARLQDRMTLMRDAALAESDPSVSLEGGLEGLVARRAGELSPDRLVSHIRRYAEWDRVSLVCAPL